MGITLVSTWWCHCLSELKHVKFLENGRHVESIPRIIISTPIAFIHVLSSLLDSKVDMVKGKGFGNRIEEDQILVEQIF